MSSTEYYEYEESCQHAFNDETLDNAAVATSETIGAETCLTAVDASKDSTGDDSANNLAYHVSACVLRVDAASEEAAESDCRIDVATRDAADGVRHGNDREAEGDSCAYYCCCVSF